MRRPLLLRKLLLCSVTFDFARIGLHTEEKDLKRQTLLELVDYCDTVKCVQGPPRSGPGADRPPAPRSPGARSTTRASLWT